MTNELQRCDSPQSYPQGVDCGKVAFRAGPLAIVGFFAVIILMIFLFAKPKTSLRPVATTRNVATTRLVPTTPDATSPSTTTIDPGQLPQTSAKPTTTSSIFLRNAQALWSAVVRNDPQLGVQAFFPKSAYLQVKAISNPAQDWTDRLMGNFITDVHTLHAQLGSHAAQATLVGLIVPESSAVWIVPGVEYNKGSYWRVYGSSLRYRLPDGSIHDLAVTSLISWRGEWYVVHLGAIR